jgi:predicted ATPase/class 3 adenylate cyclase
MVGTTRLPEGTVTLLFSDMEGSTRLLHSLGDQYIEALDAQRRILRETWAECGGTELGTEGDSFYVVFPVAGQAVDAVAKGQRRLAEYPWPAGEIVRVRMGLHTGSPVPHDGAYVGMDVHRAARIAAAAHGGQVTLSAATAELVSAALPPGLALRDLGSHRLKDLPGSERIFQLDIEGVEHDFPPLRTLGASSTLPLPDGPLLGRGEELTSLKTLVAAGTRLLTLTGMGGSGKTALATELARSLVPDFPDGAYFVPLASVREADGMWGALASTMAVGKDGDGAEVVPDFLASRRVVVVLDNLEQLGAADTVVARLLAEASHACIIATSRRPLHVAGEHEFPVLPLPLPTDSSSRALDASPAVGLFVRHASRVRPGFSLTAESASAVVEICRALDGLPLAIELAAARSKLLGPQAILRRLGTVLDLTAAEAARPERHRNLRATIDWSYRLLDHAGQAFFARLGAFVDGADLDAVSAVCADVGSDEKDPLDLVLDIVDASLATVREGSDGEPRIVLLETVRAFAASQLQMLDPDGSTRARHAGHYLRFVRQETGRLSTAQYADARAALDTDHANICAALEWSLNATSSQRDVGLAIAALIGRHWNVTAARLSDCEHWLTLAVDRQAPDSRDLAQCMAVLANCLRFRAKDPARRTRLAVDSVAMLRRLGARNDLPYPLRTLAAVERERGDIAAGCATFDEVISIVRELGDPAALRIALCELGGYEATDGNLDRSRELEEEAVEVARQMGDLVAVSDSQQNLSCTLRMLGRPEEAERMMRQVIPVALAHQDAQNAATLAEDYAAILADLGHDVLAARLIGAAEGWHQESGLPASNTQLDEIAGAIGRARARLAQAEWDHHYRAGHDAWVEDELAAAALAAAHPHRTGP